MFEGFKDLGSTSTTHQLSFFCGHCRESDLVNLKAQNYDLINLKAQNSLNIGHNANPTFNLMNNQFNLFEDTRGFILDTPKYMKLDFFFWC